MLRMAGSIPLSLLLLMMILLLDAYDEESTKLRVKRVVGGTDAQINEFPFQVSLRYFNSVHICGGALISERHVLSAAHCVCGLLDEPYNDLTVVTGTNSVKNGGEIHEVKNVRCHPDYSYGTQDSWTHDLLVITLKEKVNMNPSQAYIDLPTSDILANISVILTGWGRFNLHSFLSDNLQKVTVTTLSNEDCQNYYNNTILPSQICTFVGQGVGACKGDSGSPLIYENTLVGIFSWTKPCAVGSPDVYCRVYQFLDFIEDTVKQDRNQTNKIF